VNLTLNSASVAGAFLRVFGPLPSPGHGPHGVTTPPLPPLCPPQRPRKMPPSAISRNDASSASQPRRQLTHLVASAWCGKQNLSRFGAAHTGNGSNAGPGLNVNAATLVKRRCRQRHHNVNSQGIARFRYFTEPVNVSVGVQFSPGDSPARLATGATHWNSRLQLPGGIADASPARTGWTTTGTPTIQCLLAVTPCPTPTGRVIISLSHAQHFRD